MIFEVGQRVKLIKHGGLFSSSPLSKRDGLKVGQTYTIREISSAGNIRIKEARLKFWLSPDLFESAGYETLIAKHFNI